MRSAGERTRERLVVDLALVLAALAQVVQKQRGLRQSELVRRLVDEVEQKLEAVEVVRVDDDRLPLLSAVLDDGDRLSGDGIRDADVVGRQRTDQHPGSRPRRG